MACEKTVRVQPDELRDLCVRALEKMDVPGDAARVTADVLLTADLRGIDSHGVARLGFYLERLRDGTMLPRAPIQTVHETGVTAVIDAGGGMGPPVSRQAMEWAIQKALDAGAGFVAVRNSNHYGIAGYYAMMALEHNCIGVSMTNAFVFVVPTFARKAMLGTNPIALAAPAGEERPFVLDMATSAVPFGKLEIHERLEESIPPGWAIDEIGEPATDPGRVMDNLRERRGVGGGLLPLGGAGDLLGGHKGYGLAMLVDILCGVLAGALYADLVYPTASDGAARPSGIGHFFAALRVDAFRQADEFKAAMDDLQRRLKDAPRAEGQERIYIHGEKEFEEAERRTRQGIPLSLSVLAELREIAGELDIPFAPLGVAT
jgi:L-2-hydroxycarboxylate dehydrogenase (NAD+)